MTRNHGLAFRLLGAVYEASLLALAGSSSEAPGHANTARTLVGRIAGIEESRLQRLVAAGDVDTLVASLGDGTRIRKGR